MPRTRVEIDDLGEIVIEELFKRLGNPSKAEKLPGTMLLRLAEHYLRYRERQEIRDSEEEVIPITFLEAFEEDLLPPEYQHEKLSVYKDWLETQLGLVNKRLGEVDERDQVPGVPGVVSQNGEPVPLLPSEQESVQQGVENSATE